MRYYNSNVSPRYGMTPEEIGKEGEKRISDILEYHQSEDQKVINNYTFRTSERTCQIDHILIRPNGIFVIETKNLAGMIFGNEDQEQWTQVLAYGKDKYRFYNPVKQNKIHIIKLQELLNTDFPIFSIVVFTAANIDNVQIENVFTVYEFEQRIYNNKSIYLNQNDIIYIYQSLIYNRNRITEQTHLDSIDQIKEEIDNFICPRCKSKLIIKKGPYGTFLGCSKYPECTFTIKYSGQQKQKIIENKPLHTTIITEEPIRNKKPKIPEEPAKGEYTQLTDDSIELTRIVCPLCKSRLARKKELMGSYLFCLRYPDCLYSTKNDIGYYKEEPEVEYNSEFKKAISYFVFIAILILFISIVFVLVLS